MVDEFDRLFDGVEGEDPSPVFVARLRSQLVEEAGRSRPEAKADSDRDVEFVTIVPEEGEPGPVAAIRWRPIGLAVAAILLVVALASLRQPDLGSDTTEVSSATPPDVPLATTVPVDPSQATESASTFDPTAELLTTQFSFLDQGPYRTSAIGTAFTFVVDDPLSIQTNSPGQISLSHPASSGFDDRVINFGRLTALADPFALNESLSRGSAGWPASDVEGWLDALPPSIRVTGRSNTVLGGRDAVRFDVELVEMDCPNPGGRCIDLATNHGLFTHSFIAEAHYRVWVVDQDDAAPILVVAAVETDADLDWLDVADRVLASVAFGEPADNPIGYLETGQTGLPIFRGLTLEVTEPTTIVPRPGEGYGLYGLNDWAFVDFVGSPLTRDGVELTSVDDVVAVIEEQPLVLTELEPVVVVGIETRVFDLTRDQDSALPQFVRSLATLRRGENDQRGWFAPAFGRIWLIEHPERGVLMVVASSGGAVTDDEYLDLLDRSERILESLTLDDG